MQVWERKIEMSPELQEYIKELEAELAKIYKNYTGSEYERGQSGLLEEIIPRLKEIESHY